MLEVYKISSHLFQFYLGKFEYLQSKWIIFCEVRIKCLSILELLIIIIWALCDFVMLKQNFAFPGGRVLSKFLIMSYL